MINKLWDDYLFHCFVKKIERECYLIFNEILLGDWYKKTLDYQATKLYISLLDLKIELIKSFHKPKEIK